MVIGVAAALLACLAYGVGSVLQAYGARKSAVAAQQSGAIGHVTSTGGPTLRATLGAALTAAFIAGMILDVVGFSGGVVSARLIPLFLSQTIMSANIVVTAILAGPVLGIRLRTRDWVAIATVVTALCVLGFSAGQEGGGSSDPVLHWAVLGTSMVILAGGALAIRLLGSRAAIVAGLSAGVLFGGLAIAVRILEGLDPLHPGTVLSDPAFWTILITGVGGFYLFTVALQVGSVNGATAALVVGETVVPGVVGVVLLGDTARPGLDWLVALGFVAAVVGAVAVAIFGAAGHAQEYAATGVEN